MLSLTYTSFDIAMWLVDVSVFLLNVFCVYVYSRLPKWFVQPPPAQEPKFEAVPEAELLAMDQLDKLMADDATS